jgi:hypothetical protein
LTETPDTGAMPARERTEHRFIDGKPKGLHLTVEELDYQGTVDGKPSYALPSRDRWKSAAITSWVGLAVVVAWCWMHSAH